MDKIFGINKRIREFSLKMGFLKFVEVVVNDMYFREGLFFSECLRYRFYILSLDIIYFLNYIIYYENY